MKLNWGHYILFSFVLFVLLILFMVYRSYQSDNELVAEDYYNQEIKFQDVIDKKNKAFALKQNITWTGSQDGILIEYPVLEQEITGKIILFRPSDQNRDVTFDIQIDQNHKQRLNRDSFVPGKYLIKIDWKSGSEAYYTEGTVYISE